jgi:hypothetical protein
VSTGGPLDVDGLFDNDNEASSKKYFDSSSITTTTTAKQQHTAAPGLPDFYWHNIPKRGKTQQMTITYLYQIATKCTK